MKSKYILIAIDIHQENRALLDLGAWLANHTSSNVRLVFNIEQSKLAYMGTGAMAAMPVGEVLDEEMRISSGKLDKYQMAMNERLKGNLVCEYEITLGVTENSLLAEEDKLDPICIVMGKHVSENWLDSIIKTSFKTVVNSSACPVIIVPPAFRHSPIENMLYDATNSDQDSISFLEQEFNIPTESATIENISDIRRSMIVHKIEDMSFIQRIFTGDMGSALVKDSEVPVLFYNHTPEHVLS